AQIAPPPVPAPAVPTASAPAAPPVAAPAAPAPAPLPVAAPAPVPAVAPMAAPSPVAITPAAVEGETDDRPRGFAPQNSLAGSVGLLRMGAAEVGRLWQLRLGLHGEY